MSGGPREDERCRFYGVRNKQLHGEREHEHGRATPYSSKLARLVDGNYHMWPQIGEAKKRRRKKSQTPQCDNSNSELLCTTPYAPSDRLSQGSMTSLPAPPD